VRVYVAGPISKPPLETNIRRAMDAAAELMLNDFEPFVPHLYCFMQITHPMSYERWMALDLAFLSSCAAVLRIPGDSPGADRECAHAAEVCGIPVFHSIQSLVQYRDEIKSEVRELAPELQRVESPEVGSSRELSSLGRAIHVGERSEKASEDSKEDIGRVGS
jgi:hypothetical protein